MSFLDDQRAAAKAAVEAGNPEGAAEITMHALLEGPGTFEENLTEMSQGTPPETA
ncbi:hypothetical protein [Streptomyces sp. SGAir0957]